MFLSCPNNPPTLQVKKTPPFPFFGGDANALTTLLLGDTDGAAAAAGGLGMLTTDAEAPVVTETAMGADLLEALEIVAELGGDAVGEDLAVLAVDDVALSVEEPRGDLVLGGVLDDGDDALELFRGELTSALVQVDCCGTHTHTHHVSKLNLDSKYR